MDRPISMTTGFGSYLMNIGKVSNKGVYADYRFLMEHHIQYFTQ